MSSPVISVVMPVYNSEPYLAEAIESILNQTFADFEFLIFDDGSTDRSPEIIREYARKDARIIPQFSPINRGYVVHLNEGIRRSRGKYVARMDSDDVALPKRFEMQQSFLACHPAVGIVGSSWITIDEKGSEVGLVKRSSTPSYVFWRCFFGNPLAHPTVTYRKEIVASVDGYNELRVPSEDYDLWTRIIDNCEFSNIEEPLLKYRVHSASVSILRREYQLRLSYRIQTELWEKWLGITLSDSEVCFLRRFHLGFDELPINASYDMFRKINALRSLVMSRYGDVDPIVHVECFERCLYLASRTRGRLFFQGLRMTMWLLTRYPTLLVKWFLRFRQYVGG